MIHMKCQDLFCKKKQTKTIKLKVSSAVIGILRVKYKYNEAEST